MWPFLSNHASSIGLSNLIVRNSEPSATSGITPMVPSENLYSFPVLTFFAPLTIVFQLEPSPIGFRNMNSCSRPLVVFIP